MKKKFLFFCLVLFLTKAFSQEMEFIVKEDIELKGHSRKEITNFKKGNILISKQSCIGIGVYDLNDIKISTLTCKNTGFDYTFPVDYIMPLNTKNILPSSLKTTYWIPKYYYDQLLQNNHNELMFQNEKFWYEWKPSADGIETWKDDFYIQRFVLGDYFINVMIFPAAWSDVDFICYLNEVTDKQFTYSVQIMSTAYEQYSKHLDDCTHPEFKFLFKKDKPFKIIFIIDGDFLKMYIDEISDKTLFKTLAKATPEACKQIEEWIAEKSDNLSAVVWPHHADGTSEYEDTIRYPDPVVIEEPEEIKIEEYQEENKEKESEKPPIPDENDPNFLEILRVYYPEYYSSWAQVFKYRRRMQILKISIISAASLTVIIIAIIIIIKKKRKSAK